MSSYVSPILKNAPIGEAIVKHFVFKSEIFRNEYKEQFCKPFD